MLAIASRAEKRYSLPDAILTARRQQIFRRAVILAQHCDGRTGKIPVEIVEETDIAPRNP